MLGNGDTFYSRATQPVGSLSDLHLLRGGANNSRSIYTTVPYASYQSERKGFYPTGNLGKLRRVVMNGLTGLFIKTLENGYKFSSRATQPAGS